jgi:hypothetical protein
MIPIFLASVDAHAEDTRLEVPAAARRLTIGRYNVLLGVEGGLEEGAGGGSPEFVLPTRVGVTRDLEIFAGPVIQTHDPIAHDPALGVLYRLVRGRVEVGGTAYGDLSVFGKDKQATIGVGLPLRIHAGDRVAVDTGAIALIEVLPDTAVGAKVPVGLTVSATRKLFFGVSSGVTLADFTDAADTLQIPVGGTVGCTIARHQRPLLDFAVRGEWADIQSPDTFGVLGSVELYLYPGKTK